MNKHVADRSGGDRQTDIFVNHPRVFVLARPCLAEPIDEFYEYFDANVEKAVAVEACSAESIVENAGRVCYLSFSNPSAKTTAAYVRNLIRQGHESVLEHVAWTLV